MRSPRRAQAARLLTAFPAAFLAIMAAVPSANAAPSDAGAVLGGGFAQSASLRHALGDPLTGGTAMFGSASDLSLSLVADASRAVLRTDARLSLLSGADAQDAWAELAATGGVTGAFTAPTYRTGTAPRALAVLRLERAYLSLSGDGIQISAGRFPVNFGVGTAFSPVDLFSSFDYSGAIPRRLAVDGARVALYPAPLLSVELAVAPEGRSASGRIADTPEGRPLTALRLSVSGESGISGGLVAARDGEPWVRSASHAWIAGTEARMDLPFAGIYAEAAARFSDGSAPGDARLDLMAGVDVGVGDAVILVEYHHETGPSEQGPAGLYGRGAIPLDDWTGVAASVLWSIESGALTSSVALMLENLLGADCSFSVSAIRNPDIVGGAWIAAAGALATLAF